MSNDNNQQFGLGPVQETQQSWGMWILSWIFWMFFKTGESAGSVARRTSKVPGKTKEVFKATKNVAVEVVRETKKGYKAGRTYVAPPPEEKVEKVEDAQELPPLPFIDPKGRKNL